MDIRIARHDYIMEGGILFLRLRLVMSFQIWDTGSFLLTLEENNTDVSLEASFWQLHQSSILLKPKTDQNLRK